MAWWLVILLFCVMAYGVEKELSKRDDKIEELENEVEEIKESINFDERQIDEAIEEMNEETEKIAKNMLNKK